jgi:hypothetical protein
MLKYGHNMDVLNYGKCFVNLTEYINQCEWQQTYLKFEERCKPKRHSITTCSTTVVLVEDLYEVTDSEQPLIISNVCSVNELEISHVQSKSVIASVIPTSSNKAQYKINKEMMTPKLKKQKMDNYDSDEDYDVIYMSSPPPTSSTMQNKFDSPNDYNVYLDNGHLFTANYSPGTIHSPRYFVDDLFTVQSSLEIIPAMSRLDDNYCDVRSEITEFTYTTLMPNCNIFDDNCGTTGRSRVVLVDQAFTSKTQELAFAKEKLRLFLIAFDQFSDFFADNDYNAIITQLNFHILRETASDVNKRKRKKTEGFIQKRECEGMFLCLNA